MNTFIRILALLILAFCTPAASACSFAPCPIPESFSDYYDAMIPWSSETLRQTLHETIDDHTRFPYTSFDTDTWDVLEQADEDPNNSANVIAIYRNASFLKRGGGNDFYNREHTWPKSYGFPDNGPQLNYPYTDMHHLFLADSDYNFYRSNKPFANCAPTCIEYVTETNAGRGGSEVDYPGDSNWTDGEYTEGRWEVRASRRGDIARAMFYMDVRYAGGTHGVTSAAEPDLRLTDELSLIDASRTGNNESVAYMGMLPTLLQWHLEDPVDEVEIQHHEVVSQYQGNRNPFIDHPELVSCIFADECPALQLNPGMNDAWYNPETDGQGFFITVFPELGLVSLAWFTYDTTLPAADAESNLGDPGHRWLTALGPVTGNQSVMNIDITSGGIFDTPSEITRTDPAGSDGSLTLTFESCSKGTIEYDIVSINRQGSIPIQRVSGDNTGLCNQLAGQSR